MLKESDIVSAASQLRLALETNTVDTLSAADFRVFIDGTKKSIKINHEILEEASKNLLLILASNQLCNDKQIVIAKAYSSLVCALQESSENIFQHFRELFKENDGTEYKIFLCHAILQSSNSYWTKTSGDREGLLQEIFKVVQTLVCEFKSTSFLAFKVFNNLLCKIHQLNPAGDGISPACFKTMLDIVMSNWENPMTGVRQQNSLVLDQLLLFNENIWKTVLPQTAVLEGPNRGSIQHQCLLELVLTHLSWSMKSKYFLLMSILQQSNILQALTQFGEDIVAGLVFSLSLPHLVSAGTDLYRIILATLSLTEWHHWFTPHLTHILTDSNLSLELENLFNYWMPSTFKKLPEALENILDGTLSLNIYSYISLHKMGRKEGFTCSNWDLLDKSKINSALDEYSDKIRSQSFGLVCISAKTNILPHDEEFDKVQQFLRHNINSDNTALRQNMLNSFTTFVIRIRDSLMYTIKSKLFEPASKTKCFSFLDWLHSFLLFNMEERCNYQRKIASLEMYKIVLSYFGDPRNKNEKSYTRKSNKDHLCLKAQESNFSWEYKFESNSSQKILIKCLLDEDNSVRSSSASILMSYFKISDSDIDDFENLFLTSLSLCSGQIFYKAESGALVVQVLVTLAFNSSCERFKEIILNKNSSFFGFLLASAEEQFRNLKDDLLKGASQGSFLYGTLQALELLLTNPPNPEFKAVEESHQERLITLLEDVTSHFIMVLSTKSDPKSDFAPSFGEMGMAIAALVESSSVKESDVTVTTADDMSSDLQLTAAQQLVLSCVWLNLKECSKLSNILVSENLSLSHTRRCVSLVVSVLLKCRHKGAIESAGLALYNIIFRITSRNEPQVVAIATQLMDSFLDSLVVSTNTTVSRRSAGLAILVHRLITGDARPQKPLLHTCVARLLPIAASSEVLVDTTLSDLPQSQSLHFLRSLVQESLLRSHMAQYTLNISLVALNNLASPIWTIRNAALQLFGALVPKLVGQKPHQEEGRGCHRLAFEELFTHAQPLVEMILTEFSIATKTNSVRLHSKLMPLLTLLSNVTMGLNTVLAKEIYQIVQQFQQHFQQLFKSNIFNVRKLSAKAHSLFLTSSEIMPMISRKTLELLNFLSGEEGCMKSENELHGNLMNIYHLLERFHEEKVGMKKLVVEDEYLDTLRLLSLRILEGDHSYFVKALVYDFNFPKTSLSSSNKFYPEVSFGLPHFINRHYTHIILTLEVTEIPDVVYTYLMKQTNYDVHLACLKALKALLRVKLRSQNDVSDSLQTLLIILKTFLLQRKHHTQLVVLSLQIMLCLLEKIKNFSGLKASNLCCPEFLAYSQELFSSNKASISVTTLLLPAVYGLLPTKEAIDLNLVQQLSTLIYLRSDPDFEEDVRIYAAKSMTFLISCSKLNGETKSGELIWKACVNFLQDEVTEVRFEASKFITAFSTKHIKNVWNPYLSLEKLFQFPFFIQLMLPEQALVCLFDQMVHIVDGKKSEKEISNPFDHGIKSVLVETTVVSHLAYCAILELINSCKDNVESQIKELCSAFHNDCVKYSKLQEYIQQIENSLN